MSDASHARPPCALTIAGSDCGGGAGIQADLKTFAAFGVQGLSAITALTAQNSQGVRAVHVPPVEFLRAQIDACFEDFDVRAVKLGMLANAAVIHAVTEALEVWKPAQVVLDPVMIATSGAALLEREAVDALRERLLPLATVLTPNIAEAEALCGFAITDAPSAGRALRALLETAAGAVLLKGAHLDEGDAVIDRLAHGSRCVEFTHPRLQREGHGTGCTLASAITAGLALGRPLEEACREAVDHVAAALARGTQPGRAALTWLDHFGR